MHIIFLTQQVSWVGGKGLVDLHPWDSKINSTNDMGCSQHWDVDQILPTYVANLGQMPIM